MTIATPKDIIHDPTWFGPSDEPLFGWLSFPTTSLVRGGVILAPPVGLEARGARRAFRALATSLAENGYVSLRFDYRGTGDSSGDFGSALPNPQWLEDVKYAVEFLRDSGITSVSGVGMRLGATLIGLAASQHQLDLESLVVWDPCESGGSYLRELRALETLRRKNVATNEGGEVETAEFLFSREMASSVQSLSLIQSTPATCAKRVLVVSRRHRPLSSSLRAHFELEGVTFETTDEQETLIDVHPFFAIAPLNTIERIVEWILESGEATLIAPHWNIQIQARLPGPLEASHLIERAIKLGPRGLFAMVSEPNVDASGPWIVLLGGIHEDHTGPSRLWVELSRRWACAGLRCVRLDVSGMGESSRNLTDPPMRINDPVWIRDVHSIGFSLTPEDPSNCVYVGMCSGGLLALHGALGSGARAVCVVNPPIGPDFVTAITRLQNSSSEFAHKIARVLARLYSTHPWVGTYLWQALNCILPKKWSTNVVNSILSRGTELFVLASLDDVPPHRRVPSLRHVDGQQYDATKPYPYIYVPGLDHDMSFAVGRERTTKLLEDYVQSHYGSTPPSMSDKVV